MQLLLSAGILLPGQALDRVTAAVNPASRVVLPNSIHPAVLSATTSAPVDPAIPMDRMILQLQADARQEAALQLLLTQQQDPASSNFHNFLTPDQFANSFGVSAGDIAKVTAWLSSNGFHIDEVVSNRRAIVFSGTAGQVRSAFNTEIRQYLVQGKRHFANSAAPQIPAALASVIAGFAKLNDFHAKPSAAPVRLFTDGVGQHELSPGDYAVIYNLNPLFAAGINGTAQTIAVIGRSNVDPNDISSFRSQYGLVPASITNIYATGVDPGVTGDGDTLEATLDLEWAGAVAPNANIKFVMAASTGSSDGLDLAAQYAVTHNTASIISISFGACEASSNNAFYSSLWQQAAAQGISVIVAAGDSGPAGCDDSSAASGTVRAVNALCSTPYDTCVGGTMFDDLANPGQYWLNGNNQVLGSAISYIPESVWNESATVANGSGLLAAGGGASNVYAKPYWQAGPGVPADGHRDVPDVSLSAAQHDGYLMFYNGATQVVSGTSAGAPAFAGMMALVNQKNGGAQGNVNATLYPLAAKPTVSGAAPVFHDITAGNNSVPGVAGYGATAGYDLASGLGSVDATQLANNWTSATNSFSISSAAYSVTASPGQSGVVAMNVSSSGAFHSAIALNPGILPAGVQASFSSATITGSGASTVTLTVAGWAVSGTYPVTITATGGGITRTATFNLTLIVNTACTLAATPASLTVVQSQSASLKLSCGSVQGVFSKNLSLSVAGMPAGVTATFSPANSLAAGTAVTTLIINAANNTAPGAYALTVTATLPGANPAFSRSLNIPVTVNAPATFNVTASASKVVLQQGASAALTLTSVHSGAFNSSVAFTIPSLPTGVTASFAPSSTVAAPGDGSVTVTLQATGIATTGNYNLLITAIGAGLYLRIPLALQVTAAPAFSLSSAGAVLTLRQSNTAAITFTTGAPTGGFNLPVSFTVGGLPAGVTAAFSTPTIPAPGLGSSVMTLTATATASTGVSTVTVTATGGAIKRYANIQVTLTPPPTFSLTASLPTYSMIAGGNLTETISSKAFYGFTSNIQLSSGTLPSGLSTVFSASTINGAYGYATMTIQTAPTLAAGSYSITVSGTDPISNNTQSTVISLLVGAITTTLSTPSVTLASGVSAVVTVTVTATSYTGTVSLSLPSLPANVTGAFSATTITGSGASTLTLSAGPSLTPGTYVVNIRSLAAGVTATTPLTVQIH